MLVIVVLESVVCGVVFEEEEFVVCMVVVEVDEFVTAARRRFGESSSRGRSVEYILCDGGK